MNTELLTGRNLIEEVTGRPVIRIIEDASAGIVYVTGDGRHWTRGETPATDTDITEIARPKCVQHTLWRAK